MTNKEHITRERAQHHAALASLRGTGCKLTGIQIWRKLRAIERRAREATTAQCNGNHYGSQPYRNQEDWDGFCAKTQQEVLKVFGITSLPGIFINGDARGYALKLDPEKAIVPQGMVTDWGNFGILAAEIE
jgi:hypothetical protein